jgi:hypothetical protein
MSIKGTVLATYLGSGDSARRFNDYYPAWLDNLADDVTVEGSLLDGAVQGPEAVRTILVTIRSLYDHQEFNFAGPYGDNAWLEDYIAQVRGEPIGCVVLVPQRRRADPAHRGELPATPLAAARVPPAGREVRRHPLWGAVRSQRVVKRIYP